MAKQKKTVGVRLSPAAIKKLKSLSRARTREAKKMNPDSVGTPRDATVTAIAAEMLEEVLNG